MILQLLSYHQVERDRSTRRNRKTKIDFLRKVDHKVPGLPARAKGPLRIPGEVGSIRLLKGRRERFSSEGLEFGVAYLLRRAEQRDGDDQAIDSSPFLFYDDAGFAEQVLFAHK